MTPSDSLKHPALRTSASRVYGPKQDRFELLKFFKAHRNSCISADPLAKLEGEAHGKDKAKA